jgi:hypothetical protein
MNARHGQFVKLHRRRGAGLLACASGCALLSACVGNPFQDAKVDPRSPIAAEVAKSVNPNAPYPTFAAIPPVPKDMRPRRQYGIAASQVDKAAAQLLQATADDKWALQNTGTFASEAQSAAGPQVAPPPSADTDAFAAALRRRATPPPRGTQ